MTPKQTNNSLAWTLGRLQREVFQIRAAAWPHDHRTANLATSLLKAATELADLLSVEIEAKT